VTWPSYEIADFYATSVDLLARERCAPALWLIDMLTNKSDRVRESLEASRTGIEDRLRDQRWIEFVLTVRRNNDRLFLAQRQHGLWINVEVRLHELRRR